MRWQDLPVPIRERAGPSLGALLREAAPWPPGSSPDGSASSGTRGFNHRSAVVSIDFTNPTDPTDAYMQGADFPACRYQVWFLPQEGKRIQKEARMNRWLSLLTFGLVAVLGSLDDAAAQDSHVTDIVVNNSDGTFTYRYRVHNDSPSGGDVIVDWELPWFGDAGITAITSAVRWDVAIETIGVPNPDSGWAGVAAWRDPSDPMFQGFGSPFTTVTQVVHWFCVDPTQECDQIVPGDSLGGFGFRANFDRTDAPYQVSWLSELVRTGDPSFPLGGIPNSPAVGGTQQVPEPGTLVLLASGLAGLGVLRRLRSRTPGPGAYA